MINLVNKKEEFRILGKCRYSIRAGKGLLTVILMMAVAVLLPACSQTGSSGKGAPADLVIKNATVQTMVNENDVAQAVAIKGDTIVYVGDNEGVAAFEDKNTQVVDLEGGMLTPGFMDGHIHAPSNWVDRLFGISLEGIYTEKEYLAKIKEFVDANPKSQVYTGAPFMLNAWQQSDGTNPGPQKKGLDDISADKPIIIYDVAHHSIWTNSKGLELGGITRDTPVPVGGAIAKDDAGEPTGYLSDAAADLVTSTVDLALTPEKEQEAVKAFQQEANSYGITGITNIVGALGGEKNDSSTYAKLATNKELTLRMRIANTIKPGATPDEAIEIVRNTQKEDSDMVAGGTIKMFYDGVTESGTAFMTEPYLEAAGMGKGWYGEPIWDKATFDNMVAKLDAAGIQVHVHAIGDGAVQATLNSYETAKNANGQRDARHTITHECAILDKDIDRLAELNVVSALQFLWMYADPLYELEAAFIGTERALAMYPTKTIIDKGGIITGASDAPVTAYNPLEEIEVGVTRNSPYSGEENTDMHRAANQALTPYQMLEAYTKNVAYENFMEKLVGTIEVGKKADLVALGQNILTVDPKLISDTKVLYTISNGRIVYTG
ncbi:MAG: amidohydrolase [Bifidobacteriaceae bacterium]|jgi:predicted amidohydrolase YtcJ|nr:amidohydrolase [Bifidobacteriaceae bacterium]